MARLCWVCGKEAPSLEKGHLIDRCIGGHDGPSNIRPMCYECNRIKPIHDTLWEVATWKVARRHEVLFGLSKRLDSLSTADILAQMEEILVKDFGFPTLLAAWKDFQAKQAQNRKEHEEWIFHAKQQEHEITQKQKREAAEIEADRLWKEWWEFNHPPERVKGVGSVSVIPNRPGRHIPTAQATAWRKLWQRLLTTPQEAR